MAQESTEQFDAAKEWPLISHGLPYPEAIARHLRQTLNCERPFFIISRSLSRNSETVENLKQALTTGSQDAREGEDDAIQIAGIHPGMQPHTYYSEVLEVASKIKEAEADSIVTVGGGSLVDGAKAISLTLANKVTTHEALDLLLQTSNHLCRPQVVSLPGGAPSTINPPSLPIISVPTTLSAGEFNAAGGATNDDTKHKQSFYPPNGRGISVIVLDPSLTTTTPERVWLGTGLRAVDHCVETICSSNPNDEGSKCSIRGLRRLIPGLLRVKRDPGDLKARLECQLGAADSMRASVIHGVHVGASHGIGHQLGPLGVPHAETTCVCLPAVQKYNAKFKHIEAQYTVLSALWAEEEVVGILEPRGLKMGEVPDLGDSLDMIIRELGLPRTLAEYGIGRDQLHRIAESSLKDVCCQWNVVPLERKEQVLEILEMCLGDQG